METKTGAQVAEEARNNAGGEAIPVLAPQARGNFWGFIGFLVIMVGVISNTAVLQKIQTKVEKINTNSQGLFELGYNYGFGTARICPTLTADIPVYKSIRDAVWLYKFNDKKAFDATVVAWNSWVAYTKTKAIEDSVAKAKKK